MLTAVRYGLVVIDGLEDERKVAQPIVVRKLSGTGRLEGAEEPFCRLQEWLINRFKDAGVTTGVCRCRINRSRLLLLLYIVVHFYTALCE